MEQPSPGLPQFPAGPFVADQAQGFRREAVIDEIERAKEAARGRA